MAATSAFAQSSVEIYGIIDQSVADTTAEYSDATGSAKLKAKHTGVQSGLATQRIGFRGTEDLGGGTKAIFQIENALSAGIANVNDNRDANGFGSRPTFVGLSNTDVGTLTFGRQDTPLLKAVVPQLAGGANNAIGQLMWSPFVVTAIDTVAPGAGTTADGTTIANAGLGRIARTATINRAINYKTPTISGFDAEFQYGQDSVKYTEQGAAPGAAVDANNTKNVDQGYNLKYANGPLTFNLASHSTKATLLTAEGAHQKDTYVGATYNFGFANLSWQHGRSTRETAGVQNYYNKGTQFGAQIPFTAKVNAFASIGRGLRMIGTEVNGDEFKQSSAQLGVTYSFSKRTTAYAISGTQKLTGNNVAAEGVNYKEKQTVFGLNHSF